MQRNGGKQRRSGDTILPWLRSNASWLIPGIAVGGIAVGTWYKTDFATSVINPQTMLEFREKSVKRECRAAVTECFAAPAYDLRGLWQCLDSKIGK